MLKKIVLVLLFIFQACSDGLEKEDLIGIKLRVNYYTEECQGIILQQCYLVQEGDAIGGTNWELFYDPILGFEFEAGYVYDLDVTVTKVDNPPADASSLKYSLNRIIQKIKKD